MERYELWLRDGVVWRAVDRRATPKNVDTARRLHRSGVKALVSYLNQKSVCPDRNREVGATAPAAAAPLSAEGGRLGSAWDAVIIGYDV